MTDKIYQFAKDFVDTVDAAEYTDSSILQYEVGGQLQTVTIHNWENVKALDKTTIAAKANAYGWTDLTPNV